MGYPILVIYGLNDFRILACHGECVHMAVKVGSEIWLVPDVGHVDAFEGCPDEYVYKVV